jgi:hypothetical protein
MIRFIQVVVALQNIIRANGGTKGCRTVRGFADEFEFSAVPARPAAHEDHPAALFPVARTKSLFRLEHSLFAFKNSLFHRAGNFHKNLRWIMTFSPCCRP